MKVALRDVEAVRAILPADAALYLRSRGWQQRTTQPGRSSLWSFTRNAEEFEALLPMDVEFRDYPLRIGELLEVLAVAEQRSQGQIYADLLMIASDVLRIRLADPELSDGTLPIEEHAQIAQKVRDSGSGGRVRGDRASSGLAHVQAGPGDGACPPCPNRPQRAGQLHPDCQQPGYPLARVIPRAVVRGGSPL